MAAGREIIRETQRIRREQAQRNAEARAASEARITEMESAAEVSHSARRRQRTESRRPNPRVERHGHAVRYHDTEKEAQVQFASKRAERLAAIEGIGPQDFRAHPPKGAKGYTVADVRAVAHAKQERARSEDKMDRGSGFEDKGV